MRVERCRLGVVSVVALAVLACSSAGFAQAPVSTPGETNPPGWKPHAANPFAPGHLTPEQELQLRGADHRVAKFQSYALHPIL